MNEIQQRINVLLRERELAKRRNPDEKLRPTKRTIWQRLLANKLQRNVIRLEKQYRSAFLDSVYPPPETHLDKKLWKQKRSIDEIEAEIASLPKIQVQVKKIPHTTKMFEEHNFILFLKIYLHSQSIGGPCLKAVIDRSSRRSWVSDMEDSFIGVQHAELPNYVSFYSNMQSSLRPSEFEIREKQNTHIRYYDEEFGRYFTLNFFLSGPMLRALTELCEPGLDKEPAVWSEDEVSQSAIPHILCLPVQANLEPRGIKAGSDEPFINYEPTELNQLVVAELDAKEPDYLKINELHVLTEFC